MSDLPGWVMAVLIGGGIGVVLGFFVARRSASTKPIQGGALAHIFHYLGAVGAVAPAPIVLVGAIIYKLPFAQRRVMLRQPCPGFCDAPVFRFHGSAGQSE